jgi:hypothetical protein
MRQKELLKQHELLKEKCTRIKIVCRINENGIIGIIGNH